MTSIPQPWVEGVRRPSPKRLKPRTASRMATPGKVITHHARRIMERALAIMAPHSAVGGSLQDEEAYPAASRMAAPKPRLAWTMMGARQFGKMALKMIRRLLAPTPGPPSRNPSRTPPSRKPGQSVQNGDVDDPIAIIAFLRPGPRYATITMARRIWGKARMMSINRMIRLSGHLCRNLPGTRGGTDRKAIPTLTTPRVRDTRAVNSRESMSRPRSSVPRIFLVELRGSIRGLELVVEANFHWIVGRMTAAKNGGQGEDRDNDKPTRAVRFLRSFQSDRRQDAVFGSLLCPIASFSSVFPLHAHFTLMRGLMTRRARPRSN